MAYEKEIAKAKKAYQAGQYNKARILLHRVAPHSPEARQMLQFLEVNHPQGSKPRSGQDNKLKGCFILMLLMCGFIWAISTVDTESETTTATPPDTKSSNQNSIDQTLTALREQATAIPKSRSTTSSANTSPIAVTPVSQTRYINTQTINLRTGPSTDYSTDGQLKYRDSVSVTGKSGDWYRISRGSKTLWVYGPLTSISRPAAASSSGSSSGGTSGGSTGGSTGGTDSTNSGDVYATCDMSVCSQYPVLQRCSAATTSPWSVLTARQIACCWRSRDGDGDGVACYGE